MRAISIETLQILNKDGWMTRCCISGRMPVQWHHHLIYAGLQLDEWWAILPLHPDVHKTANRPEVKEKLDWICLSRAPLEELKKYSKVDNLIKKREKLIQKYGIYRP